MRIIPFIYFILLIFTVQHAYAQDPYYTDDIDNSSLSLEEQLLLASYENDTVRVLQLVASGANINATTYNGITPLIYASQNGNTGLVRFLMSHGADPDIMPVNGYSALISAIGNGYIGTAEYLIRSGADINQPDKNGNTPLMYAITVDSFYMPDMLLYYDADFQLHNKKGKNALMLASLYGRDEIVESLIQRGADINFCSESNWAPLHYATAAGKIQIMDLLILNGASLEVKTSQGYTPLSLAVALNDYAAAKLLTGYGADVNSRINNSLNPLSIAVENKNDSLISMLVNQEAKEIVRPAFNCLTFGTRFLLNPDDNHLDVSFGFYDPKYDLMANLGFGFRPKAARVLEQYSDTTFFQYWERRYFISFNLDKAFYLPLKSTSFRMGGFGGASEVLTFGGYRGSKQNPDVMLHTGVRIGGILEYDFLRLKMYYEYMNLQLAEIRNGWIGVSLEVKFCNNRKKIRIP